MNKSEQKFIAKMTGYKATNADLTCTPSGSPAFQFEIGKWFEIEGEIELCKRGFHFCVHPSGVWSYYNSETVRIFKIEAEQVLEVPIEAGADFKLVAKRIRLVEEITPGMKDGNSNTGDSNTGNSNTGDSNTGNSNTGNWNTGDRNTGDSNTGNWNTGDRNTGDRNTGDRNTGDRNTGNRNTGDRNTGDNSSGMFCSVEPKVISFDVQTKFSREEYFEKFPEVHALGELLSKPDKIDFSQFKKVPGITAKKLAKLHAEYQSKLNSAKK